MTKTIRGFGSVAAAGVVFAALLSGCGSQAADRGPDVGSISLPLAADAPSGARYRLRDATFEISNGYYYYEDENTSAMAVGGGYGTVVTVSSEDQDPNESSLIVDLEQGGYGVRLLPGWHFEKVEDGTVTDPNVEATLLSRQTVYVYVSPRSTTWAEYAFGIGSSELWLNGKVNLDINVYEDPDDYYGSGGVGGGDPGTGGAGPIGSVTSGYPGTGSGNSGAGGGYYGVGGGSP
ncbi:hypothetical protein [Sorangium atrum]|uniref:Secreted protein n=1 Tax=Sorangium atrum TaxID=2995308 RepID=A0ABT5CAL0_9BACT|nr:hypothetical protein [Sorangium aterium]MDC0682673.1 hypothetical protein [Sorangium aterium]